jgi:ActD protein
MKAGPGPIYGLMAEFETPTELVHAAKGAYAAGYRKMDTYTPYPLEEAAEAIGAHHNRVSLIVLIGAMLGMIGGYSLEYWVSVINYPINVGGKPFHSWPAFIPVTFECAVLGASLVAVFGMLALNGLPQPYHPVFNSPNFVRASRDRFFLCIESQDPRFSMSDTRKLLESFKPEEITEVPY